MTESTKKIARKLSEAVDALPDSDRKYMLGLAEGIAMVKNDKVDKSKADKPKKTG